MLIDIHSHVMDLPFSARHARNGEGFLTPELLISMQKEAHIDHSVILPEINPEDLPFTQSVEECLRICEKSEGRFIPFCNVDPRNMYNTPDADLSYVMEYYIDRGCKGIGELCFNLPFEDGRVQNLFRCAAKNHLPVTIHIGTQMYNTYGVVDTLGLPGLEQTLKANPELQILAHSQPFWSHMSADVNEESWKGYPTGNVTPGRVTELMRKYPGLLGDLSAGSGCNALTRDPGYAYEFLDEFQDKLYFGTDACTPSAMSEMLNLQNFLKEALTGKHISQEVFDKITYKNAQKLLGL